MTFSDSLRRSTSLRNSCSILCDVVRIYGTRVRIMRLLPWIERGFVMSAFTVADASVMFLHHDLLIELGRTEMVIEQLKVRDASERAELEPRLERRLMRLQEALQRLAA